jgi:hypothetical protein
MKMIALIPALVIPERQLIAKRQVQESVNQ